MIATSDYIIREDAKAVEARMTDSIDDIVAIAKTTEKDVKFVNLIHRQDNLMKLLNDLKKCGLQPWHQLCGL